MLQLLSEFESTRRRSVSRSVGGVWIWIHRLAIVSCWWLMIFAALLAAFSFVVIRRRMVHVQTFTIVVPLAPPPSLSVNGLGIALLDVLPVFGPIVLVIDLWLIGDETQN